MRRLMLLFVLLLSACTTATVRDAVQLAPADDPNGGTRATEAVIDTRTVTFERTRQTVGKTVVNSTWAGGGIVATCRTQTLTTGRKITLGITNGGSGRLTRLDFRLPAMAVPLDADNAIYTPFRGGREQAMPMDHWESSNSSLWPGSAFSPIVTLWNKQTKGTMALTFFNPTLTPVQLYWFIGPAGNLQCFNPFLRCLPNLEPGQTLTLSVEYRYMTGGPATHWAYYRSKVLSPFMAKLGIPEAAGDLGTGSVVMSSWVEPGAMRANVERAVTAGATTYIQWAPSDGSSVYYYNPYPPSLAWFDDLATAKAPGIIGMGVLINPFISPYLPTDHYALPGNAPHTNLHINPDADDVRAYDAALAGELASRGVNVAFWDSGGTPDAISGHAWLSILDRWKRQGIAIMPETSCDVAAWTAGLWMEYPYSWGDFRLAKAICPKAVYAAHTNFPDVRNGVDWKDDARGKGIRPILDVSELSAAATPPR